MIRLAHNFKERKHFHLEPVDKDSQVQKMGIFLTPDSGELIICCSKGENIDEYLK